MTRILWDTPPAGFTDPDGAAGAVDPSGPADPAGSGNRPAGTGSGAQAGPVRLGGPTGPARPAGAPPYGLPGRTDPMSPAGPAGPAPWTGPASHLARIAREAAERARRPDMILDYVREALADARRRVRRENETAAVLLAATGAAAGAVVTGVTTGHWRPGELPGQTGWLWWTGAFLWVMGLLVLVGSLCPPIANLAGRALERRRCYLRGFTGRLRAAHGAEGEGPGGGPRIDLIVLEIRRLNALADAKHRYIRRSVLLMLLSIAFCVLPVLLGTPL
ncbi:hypothetical protein ACIBCT_31140 [Streptosporangium sp. NPDC050855]|uniref:hypothetical protein n=1 Tax=Streptosporangium sp. NPDC050855 TaxID=3366194 RepID=UPI0037BBCB4F